VSSRPGRNASRQKSERNWENNKNLFNLEAKFNLNQTLNPFKDAVAIRGVVASVHPMNPSEKSDNELQYNLVESNNGEKATIIYRFKTVKII
jgi:hypothetical protein